MFPGEELGTVQDTDCINHVHVAIRKNNSDLVDPTRFLDTRRFREPSEGVTCNDFKITWKVRDCGTGNLYVSI